MRFVIADDLATTLLLATDTQVMAAPAMNVRMWEHPATQRNVKQLSEDGLIIMPPDEGAIRAKMRGAFEKALRSIESGFNDEQKAKLAEIRARQQGGGQRQNGRAVVWLMAEAQQK